MKCKLLILLPFLLTLGIIGAAYGFSILTIPAPTYSVDQPIDISVPVMSMDDYSSIVDAHRRPYVLDYAVADSDSKSAGALHCFGISNHVNDPTDPDINAIRGAFESFNPTVALIEGRTFVYFGGFDRTTKRFGESGAVYVLAKQAGIPIYSLELSLDDEVAGVLTRFTAEQTSLQYILRPYFGQRRHGPMDDPDTFVEHYIADRGTLPGLNGVIESVADIDAIWKRDFADSLDWRDCDDQNGWPGYLNDVAAYGNTVRNDHWLQVIADLVINKKERVFMTCGCSHAVRLEATLDSMLAKTGQ